LEDSITTLPIAACRLLVGKTKTTSNLQQANDNKIGNLKDSITTLSIEDCRLSVEKNKNWIPVCTGMTK
jgi:hypothetical protein